MMTFKDFVHKYILKNQATSNVKIQQVLSFLSLNDIVIYLQDGQFSSVVGIVNFHPSKGTNWVLYINEIHFDSDGCAPPKIYLNLF